MQALVEIIAGLVAVIAAAALSLFGLEMNPPQKSQPEIHRVRDCGDGLKGLEEFESDRPDLVVLDFVMPAMSGAEVASRMLGEAPDQKILFVSGYSETDAIKSIAPQSPLLPKPFRSDALCRAVRNALS